jgi:hypothetical protein
MKTINGFIETENNYHILTINELITIKGGDEPPIGGDDPFKKKINELRQILVNIILRFR